MTRYFMVTMENSPYRGVVGKLIGEIDYAGAYYGWHTLRMSNKTEILCAGEEVKEVFFDENKQPTNKG